MDGSEAAHIINALIIPHPAEPALLVADSNGGAALPAVEDTHGWHWAKVDWLNALVRERFGLRTTVLRCVVSQIDKASRMETRIIVMENHSSAAAPAGMRWVGRDDLAREPLAQRDQQAQVETWLAEAEGGSVSALRAPWARPGWFAEAAGWMERTAAAKGFRPTGPVEQVRAWTISTILKVPTTSGDLYFKASAGSFSAEALVTSVLAARWPLQLPWIVAADLARGWLLMRDLKGTRLDRVADIGRWVEALRIYARLQRDIIDDTEALLAADCADRRLSGMHGEIDAALADTTAMAPPAPNRLSEDEVAQVQALAPLLHDTVDRLAAAPVPETLEHGDFHPGNIVDTRGGIRIYDWSDACVAHPFFSLLPFFAYSHALPEPDAVAHLRAAYLEPWTRFATMPELLEIADLAQKLAVIQQVTSYRHILNATEPGLRWEWHSAIPYFLRMLLRQEVT